MKEMAMIKYKGLETEVEINHEENDRLAEAYKATGGKMSCKEMFRSIDDAMGDESADIRSDLCLKVLRI